MNLTRFVHSLVFLCVTCAGGWAVEIPVTNGGDAFPPAALIPGSLRHAVSIALPGDTIRLKRALIVNLLNDIIIPKGLDGITITGPEGEDVVVQIRAKIEGGDADQAETLEVLANDCVVRNIAFRDCPVRFGSDSAAQGVDGGTVFNCRFLRTGSLGFLNVTEGLIEKCRFELANDLSGGTGSLDLFFTKNCTVRNNFFQRGAKAGGVGSTDCEGLRIEDNTGNADQYLHPRSVIVRGNKLPKANIEVGTFFSGTPGSALVEENEAGALHAKGLNMIVRKNKLSGRVLGKGNATVAGGFADEEDEAVTALSIEAVRAGNEEGTLTGPVLVEDNETSGGVFGMIVRAGAGATGVVVQRNLVTKAQNKGIVVNQTTPVSLLKNNLVGCGTRRVRGDLPAGIYLRSISSPDVIVEENTITKSGGNGTGIVVVSGSPLVKNNTVTGGVAKGLEILQGSTPIIEGNTIEKMGRGGVFIVGVVSAEITGITLRENAVAGIVVLAGATLRTTNATIVENRGAGVIFRSDSKGTLVGGTIHGNKGVGVNVEKRANAQIDRVSFQGNTGAGIDLAPGGVTLNTRPKLANGDIDFPEQLTYDSEVRVIRGVAEPGATVQLFKVETGRLAGNKKNGEGVMYVGQTTVTGAGSFAISPGPAQEGDMFTLTATRPGAQPVTSEFSLNIEVEPAPPVEGISVSSNEEFGNDASSMQADVPSTNRTISENSRFVTFTSIASNLVNDDSNGLVDVFVRDRVSGTTERVNVSSSGAPTAPAGNFKPKSSWPSISADGRFVVFGCEDRRLVPENGSLEYNIFLRDRQTNTTTAVTKLREEGSEEFFLGGGEDCSISADGSTVAFVSIRDFAPSNSGYDLFAWKRESGQFVLVNVPGAGGEAGTVPPFDSAPRLSATGRHVVFQTSRAFVGTDTNGVTDVYLRDLEAGTTEIVSVDNDGNELIGAEPSINSDGRFVAFVTGASRDLGDTNGKPDVYLRDRQTGTLHWVSPPPAGGFPTPNLNLGCANPSVSADGRYVAFSASGNTSRPDSLTELVEDVFVHDRQTGKTVEVSLGLDGDARGGSGLPCISYDGRSIVFVTTGNLLSTDTNHVGDVYVREIAGDFEP